MTPTQHDRSAELSSEGPVMNCGSRKKSACLEKSTHFVPFAQFKITAQLRSTLLKFQAITEIDESMAANLLFVAPDTMSSRIFSEREKN
jgi:hypothetical protein